MRLGSKLHGCAAGLVTVRPDGTARVPMGGNVRRFANTSAGREEAHFLISTEDLKTVGAYHWTVLENRKNGDVTIRRSVMRNRKQTTIFLGRVLMGLQDIRTGEQQKGVEKLVVINVNRNGLDFRRENLQVVTRQECGAFSRPTWRRDGTSHFKGVALNFPSGRWMCQIRGERPTYHVTEIEAALEYDRRAREKWGAVAFQNFPLEVLEVLKRC